MEKKEVLERGKKQSTRQFDIIEEEWTDIYSTVVQLKPVRLPGGNVRTWPSNSEFLQGEKLLVFVVLDIDSIMVAIAPLSLRSKP